MQGILKNAAFFITTLSLTFTLIQILEGRKSNSIELDRTVLEVTTGFDTTLSINQSSYVKIDCAANYLTANPGTGAVTESNCESKEELVKGASPDEYATACVYCQQDIISGYEYVTNTPSENGVTSVDVDCGLLSRGVCEFDATLGHFVCQATQTKIDCGTYDISGYQIQPPN